jgi:hypothetical protein
MARPTEAALQALDRIQAGLRELDAVFSALPRDWKDTIDNSALSALDPIGVARLSNQLADSETSKRAA